MKAKLIKTPEQLYKLKFYNDEDMLACATALLSKQNCDEIFGVVDVEKLAKEESYKAFSQTVWINGFKAGFNKAMELNKDKQFTFGQLITAMDMARVMVDGKYANSGEYIYNFIQQPTVIEVEIEMREDYLMWKHSDIEKMSDCLVPKLDSNGYLILKKI